MSNLKEKNTDNKNKKTRNVTDGREWCEWCWLTRRDCTRNTRCCKCVRGGERQSVSICRSIASATARAHATTTTTWIVPATCIFCTNQKYASFHICLLAYLYCCCYDYLSSRLLCADNASAPHRTAPHHHLNDDDKVNPIHHVDRLLGLNFCINYFYSRLN